MESRKTIVSFFLLAFVALASCNSCTNPQISATYFTTRDSAVVTETAFVIEFTLKCDGPLPPNFALYAEVEGRTMPAAKVPGINKYQVSWTEESASGGERRVRLYSEDGYTALRKALRSQESIESVPTLSNIGISYSAGFSGPWVNSEVIAAVLSFVVSYIAITNKRKLLS